MSRTNESRIENLEAYSPPTLKGRWLKDDLGEVTGATLFHLGEPPTVVSRKPGESIGNFRNRLSETERADLEFLDALDACFKEMMRRDRGESLVDCPMLIPK